MFGMNSAIRGNLRVYQKYFLILADEGKEDQANYKDTCL